MTIKEELFRELETAPQPVIEEVFDFLLLAKIKHHRQQFHEPSPNQSLGAFAEQLVADLPQDILDNLPTDSAEQHDHYLYGFPKR